MGVSFTAYSFYGVQVEESQFTDKTKRVKAFDHEYPDDWVVDPKTGEPLWKFEDQPAEGFSGDIWEGMTYTTQGRVYSVLRIRDCFYITYGVQSVGYYDQPSSSKYADEEQLTKLTQNLNKAREDLAKFGPLMHYCLLGVN